MNLQDFSDMGNQIKDIVQEAVDTMNFQQLNRDISHTVNDTFRNLGHKSEGFYYQPKDENGVPIYTSRQPDPPGGKKSTYNQNSQNKNFSQSKTGGQYYSNYRSGDGSRFQTNYRSSQNRNDASDSSNARSYSYGYPKPAQKAGVYDVGFPVLKNPPGRISSVVMMSLGYAFGSILGITELVLLICGFAIDSAAKPLLVTAIGLAPLLVASVVCAVSGSAKHGRISRYKNYLKALKGKTFASFKELSGIVGKSTGFVKKDIRWMIENGYFPEGHIDEQQTCVMVTNSIYQQYLETQNHMKNRQNAKEADSTNDNTASASSKSSAELKKIEEDGRRYVQRIREANDAIPDTEISNKLYRMELIVKKIFEYVRENPDQIPQLRRFMDYYMPTTEKLVNAYKEFDTQPIQGENIKNAKSEIAKTLDTINIAYEKLYDSMYIEAAMDVSSDIAVLQTLLAQEGLTQNVFEKGADKK